jgi:hypothetical protein
VCLSYVNPVFQKAIEAFWSARVSWFLPIWICLTVGAAVCVAWILRNGTVGGSAGTKNSRTDCVAQQKGNQSGNPVAVVACLALFLAGYIAMILIWEDFAYYDNHMFTLHTLMGHNLRPPIWLTDGRFFPLGHLEFDVVRHLTRSPAGYHLLPVSQLLVMSSILLVLDDELSIALRASLTAFALLVPSVLISFGGLIFTERNILLWLVCLVFCIKRFAETKSTLWAVAAVVCAQLMIYYKEVAFILLVGLATGGLALRYWESSRPSWDTHWFRDRENRLDMSLAFVGGVFLVYYSLVMLPHPNIQYADDWRLPRTEAILAYTKLDLLVWLFVVVFLSRTYLIVRRKVHASPLWDGLALGGVAYLASYIYLGMFASYYLAPVDLIAVLYVGRFAIFSWRRAHLWRTLVYSAVVSVVLLQAIFLSAFYEFERKNVIHGKVEVARIIEARYRNGSRNQPRLFFPFTSPVLMMQFAAYLNYRGVSVEGASSGSNDLTAVVFGRAIANEGPCVTYEDLMCHPGSKPEPGDLVIVLPDDEASLADATPYRDRGQLVFSYEPTPRFPRWLCPFEEYLHVASPHVIRKKIPDRWLDASVAAWK